MRDINFFSGYKVAKTRTKDLTVLSVLVVLLLAGLIAGGYFLVNQMFVRIESDIAAAQAYIDDPATLAQLAEMNKDKVAADLAEAYLRGLQTARFQIDEGTVVSATMLDFLASRTPSTTTYNTISINGRRVSFDCLSTVDIDALDMQHSLLESGRFVSVYLEGIQGDPGGNYSFNITCILKGGDVS